MCVCVGVCVFSVVFANVVSLVHVFSYVQYIIILMHVF